MKLNKFTQKSEGEIVQAQQLAAKRGEQGLTFTLAGVASAQAAAEIPVLDAE